ncbi:MAG: hypothetical protein ACRDPJ_10485 [Nocardioidaceae bacterium]
MSTQRDAIRTFDELSDDQRSIAWAVVRSIATALWVGLVLMGLAWILGAANEGQVTFGSLAPLAGVAGLTVTMEVKSRDLEKPAG